MRLPWPWPSATGRESLSSTALPYLSAYGSAPPRCFFASAHAALHFGLQIFAKAFRNDARGGQFPQIGNRELGKVGKNRGERCRRVADQCEADVVGNGPLVVANDGRNHGSGKFFAGERSQDLRFRHVRIVENDRDNLSVTFGEQRAGHARRAATR